MKSRILFAFVMIAAGCQGRTDVVETKLVCDTAHGYQKVQGEDRCACEAGQTCAQDPVIVDNDVIYCGVNGTLVAVASVDECDAPAPVDDNPSLGSLHAYVYYDAQYGDTVLGLESQVSYMHVEFQATGRDFEVNKFTLRNGVGPSAITNVDALWTVDPLTTAFYGQPFDQDGVATFYFGNDVSSPMVVPADSTLDVYLELNTAEVNASNPSGSLVQYAFDALTAGSFQATELASGRTINEKDINQMQYGPQLVLRQTRLTMTVAAGSPTGAMAPGFDEVLRMNLSADSRGSVTMEQILFHLAATDNAGSGWTSCANLADPAKWELTNLDDASIKLDADTNWTFYTSDGSACQPGSDAIVVLASLSFNTGAATVDEHIAAGSTNTLRLRLDTSGASGLMNDTVQVNVMSQQIANDIGLSSVTYVEADLGPDLINGADGLPVQANDSIRF